MDELGFLSPNERRTATIECIEEGHVLIITYEKLLETYLKNPQFGYYFPASVFWRISRQAARRGLRHSHLKRLFFRGANCIDFL
jgi:CRP-like cAMP-binding protein